MTHVIKPISVLKTALNAKRCDNKAGFDLKNQNVLSIKKQTQFNLTTVCLAILSASAGQVYGVGKTDNQQTTILDTIDVKGDYNANRKNTEITGLGKVVKTAKDINKQQILNIRDLTRYDPGISVVEQGRGATSGYSIRGVDRNRVGLQVDGLVQTQSYVTEHSNANSGAINEIEYENVRSVEITKGAASSEYGSGALGGAVSFRTKEVDDVIKNGKNWGINTKNAYSSKNRQFVNSLAIAGKSNGFEGLLQYTHRTGHETKVHRNAIDQQQSITRVGAFTEPYDLDNKKNQREAVFDHNWFILKDECPSLNCEPKPGAKLTQRTPTPSTPRTLPPYTAKEQAQYDSMRHITEKVSASDYTGGKRTMPNPMDYKSKSWLAKLGYHFDDANYIGFVLENTKQKYDLQDKTRPSYIQPSEISSGDSGKTLTQGAYSGKNILTGLALYQFPVYPTPAYTRGYYFDEHHNKNRYGIEYKYTPKNGWFDAVNISFDRQKIDINTHNYETRCSAYPHFDKNCRASKANILSAYLSERLKYRENHNVLQVSLNKVFELAESTHKVNVLFGADSFKSSLTHDDYFTEQARGSNPKANVYDSLVEQIRGTGKKNDPYIYRYRNVNILRTEICRNGFYRQDCSYRHIKGYNRSIAFRDHIALGDKVDLGLGVRYDKHKFKSDDRFTAKGTYRNWSWNAGLAVRPTDYLTLSYRRSSGFRVPSFHELFGRRGGLDINNSISVEKQHVSELKSEKASNQEFGIAFSGGAGYLEVSYFYNKYKDLVTTARRKIEGGGTEADGYHNLQNITLSGINVVGKLDWHGLFDSLPNGLYTTLAYNRIKPKNQQLKDGYTVVRSPILDTLQPARYVIGIGYDAPNELWGVNLTATYSKAKKAEELRGFNIFGIRKDIVATKETAPKWYTYDLTAYYTIKDTITLRAGVYNLLNRRYSTWESVRQSSINAVNQSKVHSALYTAPGRNFNVAVEMKF
ncbi:lactoferrin/transferrin family TonB-dependent receptor [Actinobacillus vicugnae]|uniref:lactoferrin/transferrin family TonB-dependent receptor n=1 Tax=Actinobacillus vicugnae TaxID=2573093 RepID=UPI001240CDB2|nr:lactoferrin/transferrin family TonB-dependent receptor [Actinobacillus vicugnae]